MDDEDAVALPEMERHRDGARRGGVGMSRRKRLGIWAAVILALYVVILVTGNLVALYHVYTYANAVVQSHGKCYLNGDYGATGFSPENGVTQCEARPWHWVWL